MNQSWKNFLLAENASFDDRSQIVFPSNGQNSQRRIYPLTHLSVLTVAGRDAATFLQGQITCNIKDITETQGNIGAFCNAKGRVITTFLLIRSNDLFMLVMPAELLAGVQKKLQMYILRSAVTLADCTDSLCLIGLDQGENGAVSPPSPSPVLAACRHENCAVTLSLPHCRELIIAEPQKATEIWSIKTANQDCKPGNSNEWRYLDIVSGIPWLTSETSEEFIPQMLNLDKLGGISFTKGCYTGQEIVARTHYLGKSKREMLLAESDITVPPKPNTAIVDDSSGTEEVVGQVLLAQIQNNICKMLIVLQISELKRHNLKLKTHDLNKITLLAL